SGFAHLLDQRLQGTEARLRSDRDLLVTRPQDAEQPAQLDERLAAARLDRSKSPAYGLWLGEEARPSLCLHDHHADAVRDHIMKLASDSGPLFAHRHQRLLFALALQPSRALTQGGDLLAPPAQIAPDQPGDDKHKPGRRPWPAVPVEETPPAKI